jgi:hypothetical protein
MSDTTAPTPPTAPTKQSDHVSLTAIRYHVRTALRELELDHSGERLRDVETHLRTAAALLHQSQDFHT